MKSLMVSTNKGFEFLKVSDIAYIKGNGSYSEIYLADGSSKRMISALLKDIELKLFGSNENFYRIHKSYIINLAYVKEYRNGVERCICLLDDSRIPVAIRKANEFCEWCKTRFIHLC